uniref:Uncharacterized protein n=1 Tax=Arundo donax TaxID=35708 RepID=A0A0A8YCJ2_ARUDO
MTTCPTSLLVAMPININNIAAPFGH